MLIQQPVYYPFSEVILDNGRRRVSSDLVLKDGHYEIDFTDFEQKIIANQVKLFLMCSPHNPAGRVWTREELETVAGICHKHNVIVVADEIHEDFVWTERPHIPYATLGETFAQQAVICTAPSKTFNLAGLQVSNIFIPNYELRRKVRHEINAVGYSQLNTLGLVACEAAYQYGLPWLKEVKQYLRENINFTRAFLQQHIPQISLIEPEGTYLLWLDCRGLGLTNTELEELIVKKRRYLRRGRQRFPARQCSLPPQRASRSAGTDTESHLLLIGKLRNSCSLKAAGKRNRGLDNHAKSNCRDVRRC